MRSASPWQSLKAVEGVTEHQETEWKRWLDGVSTRQPVLPFGQETLACQSFVFLVQKGHGACSKFMIAHGLLGES